MTNIEDQMKQLRLHGMSSRWEALMETRQHHDLSLTEGLEILLQAEEEDRTDRRFERLKRSARFRYSATIEELRFGADRGLNKSQVTELATGGYIVKGESVLITGATGCGKSFIASALGHRACSQGARVLYFNVTARPTPSFLAYTKSVALSKTTKILYGQERTYALPSSSMAAKRSYPAILLWSDRDQVGYF